MPINISQSSIQKFQEEVQERIEANEENINLHSSGISFMVDSLKAKYSYNFAWLGRPIIQYPQDIIAIQEIIWYVKPDLIIETGIAHGGSLIFNASMLSLLDICDAIAIGEKIDIKNSKRKVIGIDIDIRSHNRTAIESHPLFSCIQMIEGSSIDPEIIEQVYEISKKYNKILIFLDSNHTHKHVLEELKAYAPLTSKGSYCVVFDTIIEDLPEELYPNRPWGPGNNPKTAVWEYLKDHQELIIDKSIESKLLITVAPDGYLKRIT